MIGDRRRAVAAVAFVVTLVLSRDGWAGTPTDQLRAQIDRVVKVIEDPELKKESKYKERRLVVRRIAEEIFDFTETAKRSLGRHWPPRTPAERREFVDLFADLLERSYLSKIEQYNGERIVYLGDTVDGDYDVVIEGVSLIANYRTQFNKIIQTSSYQELVRKMKAKQAEFSDVQKRTSITGSRRG